MNILGVHGNTGTWSDGVHDSSIALISNGKFAGIFEEERFSRIKHDSSPFPNKAIKQLLKFHNLSYKDIDYFDVHDFDCLTAFSKLSGKQLSDNNQCTQHHLSHACESFYLSGFESAVVLVIDGFGNQDDSASIFYATTDKITLLKRYNKKFSLGKFYSKGCSFSGIGDFTKAGSLMGLSSYGTDTGDRFLRFVDGEIQFVCGDDKYKWMNSIFPFTENFDSVNVIAYANLAKTIQHNFNEIVIDLVKYAKQLCPNETNLCLSGGCVQNCIGNDLICQSGVFEHYYCSPIPHDGGISIGNAYCNVKYADDQLEIKRYNHSYFGCQYPVETAIKYANDKHLKISTLSLDQLADKINQGQIFGYFEGRSEAGPRALGHRSILARPDSKQIANKINQQIKHREDWRPFAPIILDKLFDDIFDCKNHDLCQFMLRTIKIKENKQKYLQGVCHVDGTTRPQILYNDVNQNLYKLLKILYLKYNCIGVLNTSFNGPGEPIIETPEQAIDFLIKTPSIDGVVFEGKYLITVK